jgi:hypothetical protein
MAGIGLFDGCNSTYRTRNPHKWRKAALLALEIDVFQAFKEKQIGNLLNCHQGVSEASRPKAVPKFVNFFLIGASIQEFP